MAQVSLIFPTTSRTLFSPERALPYQRSLQEAGHAVEVIVVNGSGAIKHVDFEPSWRRVEAREPGLAEAAITGLRAARGDVLLLLDTAMGYLPADLNRVAEALVDGAADLAVASQFAGKSPGRPSTALVRIRGYAGALVRSLTGTSDPFSGLIGLTRALYSELGGTLQPLGSKFGVDILARAGGRWIDVPVSSTWPARAQRLEFDDLR